MDKGIVLEVQRKNVLLLTRDGKFLKCIKKQGSYGVGQEIMFTEEDLLPTRKYLFAFPFSKPIFTLVCCFLILFLSFYNGKQEKVMAYVSIDINPSVEVSVDSKFRVLHLEAYNAEGRQIIKELKDWKKQSLSDVIEQVINQSRLDGYLTKEKQVALTSVAADNNKTFQQKLEPFLQTVKTKYAKENVLIVYQEGTVQMRESAKRLGTSTGTYIKNEKAKQSPLVVPEATKPVLEHQPESNHIEQSPPSSEERYDSNSREGTVKTKEQDKTWQNNKQGENVEKEKETSYQNNKPKEQIEQKKEQINQNNKQKEQVEQKKEQINQNNKPKEKIEQKKEQINQNNKQKE